MKLLRVFTVILCPKIRVHCIFTFIWYLYCQTIYIYAVGPYPLHCFRLAWNKYLHEDAFSLAAAGTQWLSHSWWHCYTERSALSIVLCLPYNSGRSMSVRRQSSVSQCAWKGVSGMHDISMASRMRQDDATVSLRTVKSVKPRDNER